MDDVTTLDGQSDTVVRSLVTLYFRGPTYCSLAVRSLRLIKEKEEEGCYTRSIARDLGAPLGSVADVLRSLECYGFVRRSWEPGDDPRYANVTPPWVLSSSVVRRLGHLARSWSRFAGKGAEDR